VTPARWQRLAVLLAALAMAALTARLGFWQLDRAAQKTALQAALDSRRALPPLPASELAREAAAAAAQHHRAITLDGRWLPGFTVYLDNRQMNGRPGFYVVTPLLLADGSAVLVQRGWLPRDGEDRSRITPPLTPDGAVTVFGRIAPPPARLYDLGADAPGSIRQNLDIERFALESRLALRPLTIVQEDRGGTPTDGLQREWPQPAANVHKHYGYAFQWFALCALVIGLYAWFQVIRPRTQP
jgi:surfeit locus 1 family protein